MIKFKRKAPIWNVRLSIAFLLHEASVLPTKQVSSKSHWTMLMVQHTSHWSSTHYTYTTRLAAFFWLGLAFLSDKMNNGLMPTGRSTFSMHAAHVLQVSSMSVQADRWSEIFVISRFELSDFFWLENLNFTWIWPLVLWPGVGGLNIWKNLNYFVNFFPHHGWLFRWTFLSFSTQKSMENFMGYVRFESDFHNLQCLVVRGV